MLQVQCLVLQMPQLGIAVYNKVLKETGGDEAQAIFEAQEVINFSARGNSKVIQTLIQFLIPFLNARIQGIDVLYRSSMGSKGFAARPESDIVKRRFLTRAALLQLLALCTGQWFTMMMNTGTNPQLLKITTGYSRHLLSPVMTEIRSSSLSPLR